MPNLFFWADPHFGHHGTACLFKRDDGTPLRPFASTEEQDETLIANYNRIVRPNDKCYWLGDVTMKPNLMSKFMPRLNGKKTLIRGNHDIGKPKEYLRWFGDMHACRKLDGMLLTHIPVHPDCVGRYGANVHGHLHYRRVMREGAVDPRYLCVSVEHTNFGPIDLEEVRRRLNSQIPS